MGRINCDAHLRYKSKMKIENESPTRKFNPYHDK